MIEHVAQKILLDKFEKEPFHNLFILNNIKPVTTEYGGTCSDKALSYLAVAKASGLEAYLHSARIGGQEIHRLVRLEIGKERYFADIGNGWPSIQLFPATTPVIYECYGMRYRTTIENGVITVYHRKRGVEKKQMEIDIVAKPEAEVYNKIKNRFSTNIIYPFNNELRFSMVVGDRFLFIRDTKLEIYSNNGYEEIVNISLNNLEDILVEYFYYDIKPILAMKTSLKV